MRNIFTILFLVFSLSVFGQDNRTSLSFNNMASLQGLVGSSGLAVTVKGFLKPGDFGGGNFRWDDTSTAIPIPGMVIKNPSVTTGRWKRDFYNTIDIRWLGAIGDSVFDNAAILQLAFNFPNTLVNVPAGNFLVNSTVHLNTSNVIINGLDPINSKIISAPPLIKTIDNGGVINNITIQNLSLLNTHVNDYSGGGDTCCSAVLGINHNATTLPITNISIYNVTFSSPYGCVNGIQFISKRGGFGGLLNNVTVDHCRFINIGRIGVETLGQSDSSWFNYIKITNCFFQQLGYKSVHGMGVSFSGLGYGNLSQNNDVIDYSDIGIEMAGPAYSTIDNNRFTSGLRTRTVPYSFNTGSSDAPAQGNTVSNNKTVDSCYQMPYFHGQTGLSSRGNRIITFGDNASIGSYSVMDHMTDCRFTDDYYEVKGQFAFDLMTTSGCTFSNITINGSKDTFFLIPFLINDSLSFSNLFLGCKFIFGLPRMGKIMAETKPGLQGNRLINTSNGVDSITSVSAFSNSYSSPNQLLQLGQYYIWPDSATTGTWAKLHIKNSIPSYNGDGATIPIILYGSGTPNAVVSGRVGDFYFDVMNAIPYIKISGNNTTSNWQSIQTSGTGTWTLNGNYLTPISPTDSVCVGCVFPTGRMDVNGNFRSYGILRGNTLQGTGSGVSFINDQLAIGTSSPQSNVVFQINDNARPILLNRMSNTARDAISPLVEGMTIYSTTDHAYEYYNGAVWKIIQTN